MHGASQRTVLSRVNKGPVIKQSSARHHALSVKGAVYAAHCTKTHCIGEYKTNKVIVIALRTELCNVRRFVLKPIIIRLDNGFKPETSYITKLCYT